MALVVVGEGWGRISPFEGTSSLDQAPGSLWGQDSTCAGWSEQDPGCAQELGKGQGPPISIGPRSSCKTGGLCDLALNSGPALPTAFNSSGPSLVSPLLWTVRPYVRIFLYEGENPSMRIPHLAGEKCQSSFSS